MGESVDIFAIKQFAWTFVIPSICFLGILTNAINVLTFSNTKILKNEIYRYLFWHSLVDFIYLFLCFMRFFIRTTLFGDLHLSYWAQLYEAYIYKYLTTSLALHLVLIELIITIKRLLIVFNTTSRFRFQFGQTILACLFVSLSLYLPLFVSLKVIDQRNCKKTFEGMPCMNETSRVIYALIEKGLVNHEVMKRVYILSAAIRGVVVPLALVLLNVIITLKVHKLHRRKRELTSNFQCKSSLML